MKRFNRHRSRNRCSGFSLLELMISIGLIAIIATLSSLVSDTARNAFVTTSTSTKLEAQVKTTLDRVAIEFEMAVAGTLDPDLTGLFSDTSSISMQQVVDLDEGVIVLGTVTTISFQRDPADAADGVDNDGDGLVDEGRLVMVRNDGEANSTSVTLCKNVGRFLEGEDDGNGDENGNGLVNEPGFLIQRDGNLITLQLTLEEADGSGQLTTRTSTTSVNLRN